MPDTVLLFDDFALDLAQRELRQAGRPLDLQAKPLNLLLYLAEHRDRTVPKNELLDQVWPDVFVSETALSSALKDLRRALDDDGSRQRYIQTRRNRGYRFCADVQVGPSEASGARAVEAAAERARAIAGGDAGPVAGELAFVGRAAEQERLGRLATDVVGGVPRVALLAGEAGVGKTRLLGRFLETATAASTGNRLTAAIGRCSEQARIPYRPFAEILNQCLESDALERALGEDAAFLRRVLNPPASPPEEPADIAAFSHPAQRVHLLAAVADALIQHARKEPVVLVVEDLHWADDPSLELFEHLVRAAREAAAEGPVSMLVLATHRPAKPDSELARCLSRVRRSGDCEVLDLAGLGDFEARRLLDEQGAGRIAPDDFADIMRTTSGNPLFLREFARAYADDEGGAPAVPADIQSAVAARIDSVSKDARSALTLAALIGDRFGLFALSAASGYGQGELVGLLGEAERRGLVVREGRSYRFDHPLVSHVLRRDVPPSERQAKHAVVAGVLEDMYAGTPGEHAMEIGHHLLEAGDEVEPERVADVARRAGAQAFSMFAWRDAARFYEAAAERVTAAADQGELHFRAALAYNRDSDGAPCVRSYARAAEIYRRIGDWAGLVRSLMYETRARFTIAWVGYGEEVDSEPLRLAAEQLGNDEPVLRGLALETVAEACWVNGQPDAARDWASRALVIGRNEGDDRLCHHASMGLALAQLQHMDVEGALESWQGALAHARRAGDPWLETSPGSRIAMGLLQLGRTREADAALEDGVSLAKRTGSMGERSLALAQRASLLAARGDDAGATICADEALTLAACSRYPWGGPYAVTAAASSLARRGHAQQAHFALDKLVEPGAVFEEPGPAMRVLAEVHHRWIDAAASPATAVPVDELANLLRVVRLGGLDVAILGPVCALVDLAGRAQSGELARAGREVLEAAIARNVVFSAGWVFCVPRVLAVAAATEGRWDQAMDAFERALRIADAAGTAPELAATHLWYARSLARRGLAGDAERAAGQLDLARPLLARHEMEPMLRESHVLAVELGFEPATSHEH